MAYLLTYASWIGIFCLNHVYFSYVYSTTKLLNKCSSGTQIPINNNTSCSMIADLMSQYNLQSISQSVVLV